MYRFFTWHSFFLVWIYEKKIICEAICFLSRAKFIARLCMLWKLNYGILANNVEFSIVVRIYKRIKVRWKWRETFLWLTINKQKQKSHAPDCRWLQKSELKCSEIVQALGYPFLRRAWKSKFQFSSSFHERVRWKYVSHFSLFVISFWYGERKVALWTMYWVSERKTHRHVFD